MPVISNLPVMAPPFIRNVISFSVLKRHVTRKRFCVHKTLNAVTTFIFTLSDSMELSSPNL